MLAGHEPLDAGNIEVDQVVVSDEAIALVPPFQKDLLIVWHPAELTEQSTGDYPAWPVEPFAIEGEPIDPVDRHDDETAVAVAKVDRLIWLDVLQPPFARI